MIKILTIVLTCVLGIFSNETYANQSMDRPLSKEEAATISSQMNDSYSKLKEAFGRLEQKIKNEKVETIGLDADALGILGVMQKTLEKVHSAHKSGLMAAMLYKKGSSPYAEAVNKLVDAHENLTAMARDLEALQEEVFNEAYGTIQFLGDNVLVPFGNLSNVQDMIELKLSKKK